MPIVKDILRSSFRCVGSLRVGFGYSPSELTDGLFVLNSMLDSFATDELISGFFTLTQSFTLGTAKQAYTIGPSGADFTAGRPIKVTNAKYIVMTNASQPLHLPLEVINSPQFEAIHLPLTASTIPKRLYYNPTYASGATFGTLTLWPVPTVTSDKLLISAWQPIAGTISDENATLAVPPGYLEMIRYQLAVRLSMEWGLPLKEGVLELANEALAKVERANAPTPQMDCNPAVPMGGTGRGRGWSRLTGDFE
jgi:hypothetical protein